MTFTYSIHVRTEESGLQVNRTAFAEGCPMPDTYFKGRPVYIGDCHLDGVDSYIEDACYADTLQELDDNELYELAEHCADYLVQQNLEHYGYYKK